MASRHLAIIVFILVIALPVVEQAFADPLKNAFKQRIGNYDVQLATDPKNPGTGSSTHIQIRIAGVNGDDLLNVPVQLRLVDSQQKVLAYSSPIIVPAGHFVYNYTFTVPGRYVLYLDLKDSSYSGSILTFTFFINVAGPFDYLYTIVAPITGAGAVAIVGTMVVMKKRRQKQMKTDLR